MVDYHASVELLLLIWREIHMFTAIQTIMSSRISKLTFIYGDNMMFKPVNATDVKIIMTIVMRGDNPNAISLWWMWVLSGRKGLLWRRILPKNTRTTSKQGTMSGANAIINGLALCISSMLCEHSFSARKQSNMPMVKAPVSPMNIFCCFSALPKTL